LKDTLREEDTPAVITLAKKFRELVDANLSNSDLSITAIARQLAVSERTLYRKLTPVIHTTPKQYVINRRIEKACKLLRETNLQINEIAFLCGFNDEHAFRVAFRKIMKKNATDYRN